MIWRRLGALPALLRSQARTVQALCRQPPCGCTAPLPLSPSAQAPVPLSWTLLRACWPTTRPPATALRCLLRTSSRRPTALWSSAVQLTGASPTPRTWASWVRLIGGQGSGLGEDCGYGVAHVGEPYMLQRAVHCALFPQQPPAHTAPHRTRPRSTRPSAGVDQFSYIVVDPSGTTNVEAVGTVRIIVTACAPPSVVVSAAPDAYTTNCSAPLAMAGSVLDNDTANSSISNLRVVAWGAPSNGTLTWSNQAGFFGYQPGKGFSGERCEIRGTLQGAAARPAGAWRLLVGAMQRRRCEGAQTLKPTPATPRHCAALAQAWTRSPTWRAT